MSANKGGTYAPGACKVCSLLSGLEGRDRENLSVALSSRSTIAARPLAMAIEADYGVKIGESTVKRHRQMGHDSREGVNAKQD